MTNDELSPLKKTANHIRILTIDAIAHLGIGHLGGSLSIVDVLTLLYYRHMDVDPLDPTRPDRDRLVLSKGHAGPALYSTLALKGFFPVDWLHTLNQGGTRLPSHCDMNRTPGIDMTTGSLGQGLSAAIGICLGNRIDGRSSKVYAIIGDGETNEGQVWEAAMAASQFKLNHLIAFTDYNKLQIDGFMHEVMGIDDLNVKWVAFGWFVQRVNGHDLEEMDVAINRAKAETSRPSMIILDTKKGKGAFFAENRVESHNMAIDPKAAEQAIAMLREAGI
ncbi:MAG: transketolase [Kiritimatiellales bacterium]|nr:transketolase [Kiritimatiellales bacterium]MCF7863833.1 transketolase [Kiritimatiellales bacterium]